MSLSACNNGSVLREASISELTSKQIPKSQRVLVNRGRGNDELAPSEVLFEELSARKRELEKELGKGSAAAHNRAFVETDFETRFRSQIAADDAALAKLASLAERAQAGDVWLVCYEGAAKACHRRTLMRIAAERFGAEVAVDGVEPG